MNTQAVDQWNSYKEELRSFYEDCLSENVKLFEFYGKTFMDMSDYIIQNLLDNVLNMGQAAMGLRVYDVDKTGWYHTSFDTVYTLTNGKSLYTIRAFFASYDTFCDLRWNSKKELIAFLMHFSLQFLQSLRSEADIINPTVILNANGFQNIQINCILQIPGNRLDNSWEVSQNERKIILHLLCCGKKEFTRFIEEDVGLSGEWAELLFEKFGMIESAFFSPLKSELRVADKNDEGFIEKMFRALYPGYLAIADFSPFAYASTYADAMEAKEFPWKDSTELESKGAEVMPTKRIFYARSLDDLFDKIAAN